MKMKIFAAILLLLVTVTAHSDPTPFALSLGKATVSDVKSKYSLNSRGINKYSNGPMFEVEASQIEFDGLSELTLIFNAKQVLVGVLATLSKDKFSPIHQMLSQKYKVVSQDIPFVGNKSAKYVDGATEITLNAPHLSFQMTMNYLQDELVAAFEKRSADESAAKQRSEESQL